MVKSKAENLIEKASLMKSASFPRSEENKANEGARTSSDGKNADKARDEAEALNTDEEISWDSHYDLNESSSTELEDVNQDVTNSSSIMVQIPADEWRKRQDKIEAKIESLSLMVVRCEAKYLDTGMRLQDLELKFSQLLVNDAMKYYPIEKPKQEVIE